MATGCSVEGCDRPHHARGWCARHYQRWVKRGDPLAAVQRRERAGTAEERLLAHRCVSEASRRSLGPCWLWDAALINGGYAQITVGGVKRMVHRVAHELWIGPIPDGYEVDHLCFVRHCFRPEHLEAVTLAENRRRSDVGERAITAA